MSLLTLPNELKFRIFEYCTEAPQARLCHRNGTPTSSGSYWRFWFEDESGREIRLSLLRVCRKLRAGLIQHLASTSTLRIETSRSGAWFSSATTSLLLEQYAQHVRHVISDRALPTDVIQFFPALERLSMLSSVLEPIMQFTGPRFWRHLQPEHPEVESYVTGDTTSIFWGKAQDIDRAGNGRTAGSNWSLKRGMAQFTPEPNSFQAKRRRVMHS